MLTIGEFLREVGCSWLSICGKSARCLYSLAYTRISCKRIESGCVDGTLDVDHDVDLRRSCLLRAYV